MPPHFVAVLLYHITLEHPFTCWTSKLTGLFMCDIGIAYIFTFEEASINALSLDKIIVHEYNLQHYAAGHRWHFGGHMGQYDCKGRLPVVPVVRDFCYAIQPEWIFLRLVVPVARPSKTTTLGYRAAHGVQLLNFARLWHVVTLFKDGHLVKDVENL